MTAKYRGIGLVAITLFIACISYADEYVQLTVSGTGAATNYSSIIELSATQSVTYIHRDGDDPNSFVDFMCLRSGSQNERALLEGSRVDGPATIRLRYKGMAASASADVTATLLLGRSSSLQTEDGIAVVPADHGEPVTVVIETSTDLENWVIAQPGNYAMTDDQRFFRVRATRKESKSN